ncbi:hypothetical protein BBOV_III009570 [Babesia bovis T2Bo]|uniref:hypothetical protein n=1 Tax=Babesia bovis T2Bo TaxID=484906 RepID=UPI001C34E265|nr:hypothetical protein BBOV_III009570 [Babesia bovis T2Bo]EDO08513.2 hypothetical protein BBOV_III009570 [Babesia bovis T2Bo]
MASEAGIQLFVQHLLAKKYLSMDDLSALVRGISRGTGHDYGSNKGFIKEVNDCLSELGFMLKRVNVEGVSYFSLKDLESFHTTTTRARVPASSGTRNESRSENTSRVFEHVFTPSEVSIYMDAMEQVLTSFDRLPIDIQDGEVSWKSICKKHNMGDEKTQMSLGWLIVKYLYHLVNRFEKEGWLQFVDGRDCIVPGVRFYVEFIDNYDLSNHPICSSCGEPILHSVKSCRSCTGAVHLLCSTRVDDEIRHCRKCAHDIAESN